MENAKLEARNPKPIRMTQAEIPEAKAEVFNVSLYISIKAGTFW